MSVTTGTFPGVRIVDMPDLGAVTDTSSMVGERAGSGRFAATALRDYVVAASAYPLPVTLFGARGDGVTDDAPAINAAITSAAAAGGIVLFPPGIYIVGSTIVLKSNVMLEGAGQTATILRGKSGTTHVMLQTQDYATLQGSNTPAGPYKFGLRAMGIDGNKSVRTGGDCIQIYGYAYLLDNIEVYNAPAIGIYSEWCISAGSPPGISPANDFMEARIDYLRVFECVSDGFVFSGPHDSLISNVLVYVNGRYGANFAQNAHSTAGGTMLSQFHSYGNSNVPGLPLGHSSWPARSRAKATWLAAYSPAGAASYLPPMFWRGEIPAMGCS